MALTKEQEELLKGKFAGVQSAMHKEAAQRAWDKKNQAAAASGAKEQGTFLGFGDARHVDQSKADYVKQQTSGGIESALPNAKPRSRRWCY